MELKSTLAAQQYAANRPATASGPEPDGETGLVASFEETLRQTEETAVETMTSGADPHALVQALAETQLAVETAATVRDRVVEAYQEILRMPV
ncbi:MAG: flagellar hook-basal body complex protein FliE [Paracoccaceae bacterium]|nr:flagellar hook-basal body complex protein FliE [Paracoccaceae bacterium]